MQTITETGVSEAKLRMYAELAIRVGLNLQSGQRLLVRSPGSLVALVPFVRHVVEAAYRAGARLVDVMWVEETLDVIRLQYGPADAVEEFPQWQVDSIMEHAERGDAILFVTAADPDLYAGHDTQLVMRMKQARARKLEPFYKLMGRQAFNWLIINIPAPGWAKRVFPTLPLEAQMPRLWQAIFDTLRLDHEDPVAAWEKKINDLVARRDYLTQKRYRALKFSGPGTDLTVGLTERHRWGGGRETSRNGITFTPNLPTEEVFTMPHREQVNGVVRATKPLSYGGVLIEDFTLAFQEGRVVELNAARGESALRQLIETDDGASRLGEVALVPHSSPVAQAGHLFYSTLFDENAACHLALGDALRPSMEGGTSMDDDEFLQSGGNVSVIHADFMIGSDEINVDGITADGRSEALLQAGEWAFSL